MRSKLLAGLPVAKRLTHAKGSTPAYHLELKASLRIGAHRNRCRRGGLELLRKKFQFQVGIGENAQQGVKIVREGRVWFDTHTSAIIKDNKSEIRRILVYTTRDETDPFPHGHCCLKTIKHIIPPCMRRGFGNDEFIMLSDKTQAL